MNIRYIKYLGSGLLTAILAASCSDVVDIPSYDPYTSNGAPVIESIIDAEDTASVPTYLTEGVLNQMLKINGKNLSGVKSISFNGLEVDVRHDVYAEANTCWVTIPRKIPDTITDSLIYTTEQGTVRRYFPVNIPALELNGLMNEMVLQGDKVQLSGDYFDLYGFTDTTETSTSTIFIDNEVEGYHKQIKTDSITEQYMGILIPEDVPDNSLITLNWDSMGVAKSKTIPYRMTDQMMFGNFDGDLGWWNEWLSAQLTWGTNAGDPECLGYQYFRIQKTQDLSSTQFDSWSWNSTGFGCNWRWLEASANPEDYYCKFEVCTASGSPFYNYGDNSKLGNANGGYCISINGPDPRYQWDPVTDGLTNTYGEWVTIRIPLKDMIGSTSLPTVADQWVSMEFVIQPNNNDGWTIDHSFGHFRIEPKNY